MAFDREDVTTGLATGFRRIAIVNRGVTRADELSRLKLNGDVGEILSGVLRGLG